MSELEKLIWKPDTPGSEPAGARISAGKSGSVLMSLPKTAAVRVNWVPVTCIPSPESPAKRIVTRSRSWTSRSRFAGRGRHAPSDSFIRWCGRGGRLSSSSGNASARYLRMSCWRTMPTTPPGVVDERDVAVAPVGEQGDRVVDGLLEAEGSRRPVHQRLDRRVEVDLAADHHAEDVALGQDAAQPPVRVGHDDRIAGARQLDEPQALAERRALGHGQRIAPIDDPERLASERGDALGDGAFGELSHARSVVRSRRQAAQRRAGAARSRPATAPAGTDPPC